jgi:uncharacterized membrane protein YedE/YeeE
MSDIFAGLTAGFIFGLGLCLSGLADPAVVQGFLDVAGVWNPTLLFVMGAALTVTLIGYRLVFGRGRPLFSPRFNVPTAKVIDAALISGAVIFGVGWGLAGYCPGPAVVSLASGRPEVFVFVAAMIAGMTAVRWMRAPRAALPKAPGQDALRSAAPTLPHRS